MARSRRLGHNPEPPAFACFAAVFFAPNSIVRERRMDCLSDDLFEIAVGHTAQILGVGFLIESQCISFIKVVQRKLCCLPHNTFTSYNTVHFVLVVVARGTNLLLITVVVASVYGLEMQPIRASIQAWATSLGTWRIVVRSYAGHAASAISSQPTMARSSRLRRLEARNPSMKPNAK